MSNGYFLNCNMKKEVFLHTSVIPGMVHKELAKKKYPNNK